MTNILITGGAGFIGSHVAEYYNQKDEINKIFIIDNLSRHQLLKTDTKNREYNWNYLHQYNKIQFFKNDIRDFKFLKKFFKLKSVDIIIHTAAQTAVTTSIKDPLTDFEVNLKGSFNLLEAIRLSKLNPIIVLCSTNKVFGNNVNKCEVNQKDLRYSFSSEYINGISENFSIDLCEHTPYGTSKLCSDLYFQEYGHIYGLKTAVFRMSCIYGIRQFGVEDQGWVAHFIISALKKRKIKIYGDGKQVRDVLYVSDLIKAYDAFINQANKIKHDVFCIGGGNDNTLSLLELLEIIEEITKEKVSYEFFDWRPSDQKVFIADIRKAKEILNWSPKISPRERVKKLINWTRKNITLF